MIMLLSPARKSYKLRLFEAFCFETSEDRRIFSIGFLCQHNNFFLHIAISYSILYVVIVKTKGHSGLDFFSFALVKVGNNFSDLTVSSYTGFKLG